MDRVGNKLKHSSTLEHLCFTFQTSDVGFVTLFKENAFSTVTYEDSYVWTISTNVRAVQGMNLGGGNVSEFVPKEYMYLFDEEAPLILQNSSDIIIPNNTDMSVTPMYHSSLQPLKDKVACYKPHLNYTIYIKNVARALLQELARHRIASPSVKSTRYTLKELLEESPFYKMLGQADWAITSDLGNYEIETVQRASKYLVWTNDDDIDSASIAALENLRWLVAHGKPNDKSKFALPDAYKTELTWTIRHDSLNNFLKLRTDRGAALWHICDLADMVFDTLPEDHKHLYEGSLYTGKESE
jgi:thymidylate synthase (FAD)